MVKNSDIAFTILKQPIPYSFYMKVWKRCDKDPYKAGRVFYRAMAAKARRAIPWIVRGLKEGYAFKPCKDEEDNGGQVTAWVDRVVNKYKDLE